jgi:phospholipid/cholesterol/gamma-HCH transport system substrate-binding protein
METNVNYTIVGAFVITLIAFIVLGIIWLSAGLTTESYTTYKVYMCESVSGLNLNAPVEYNGVNVGTVSNIRISHKNPRVVVILLRIKSKTPITQGTRAKLDARALTGIAFILLEDKGTDNRPIVMFKDQNYPVIPTIPSLYTRLDTALTQINKSFQDLSLSIQGLLDKDNLNSIKAILANLNKISRDLSPLLQSSQSTLRVLETQTLPATNKAINNLDTMSQNLSEISGQIKQNPAILIRGKGQQPLGPGE